MKNKKDKNRIDDSIFSIKISEFGHPVWKEKGTKEKVKTSFSMWDRLK